MSEILSRSITDPRGDKLLDEMVTQDLSLLSVDDMKARVEVLRAEIARVEAAMDKRGSVAAAAEALFKK